MLKRIFAFFLISILLCACSNKDNRECITFSSWGSVTEVGILKEIIKDFEKANPDIKVEFLHIPQNYFQKIHLLFASNTAPDVIFINNLYLPVYENQLTDLSDTINKNKFFDKSIDALTINGRLLAVPRDISNLVIYYNKDFVKNPPIKIEDFNNMIKKNSTQDKFGMSYERNVFYAEPFMLTLGEEAGIKYYKDIEGKYAPKPSQSGSLTQAQMFLNKKITFYISGRWMYPKIKETAQFPFGVTVFPGKIYADASGWAVSKNSKHKEASKRFIHYLTSDECIDYFTSTGLIVPALKSSAKILQNKDEKAFIDAIELSRTRIPDKNYSKNRDSLNREIFE